MGDCGILSPEIPSGNEEADTFYNISLNAALMASYGIDSPAPTLPHYVTYLSSPLEEDLRVWGPASFTLYASTTEKVTSDLSFFVKVGEMVPEGVPVNPVTGDPETKPEASDPWTPGAVQLWSWGSLKAKFREIDGRRSRPGSPWHPFQNPQELDQNTVYEFQIELQPIFKTFRKGCRIWLKIASDDALYSTLDSSSRYVETPLSQENSRISIYHDAKYPSHLLLPVIPDIPESRPVKPPLTDALPGAQRFSTE